MEGDGVEEVEDVLERTLGFDGLGGELAGVWCRNEQWLAGGDSRNSGIVEVVFWLGLCDAWEVTANLLEFFLDDIWFRLENTNWLYGCESDFLLGVRLSSADFCHGVWFCFENTNWLHGCESDFLLGVRISIANFLPRNLLKHLNICNFEKVLLVVCRRENGVDDSSIVWQKRVCPRLACLLFFPQLSATILPMLLLPLKSCRLLLLSLEVLLLKREVLLRLPKLPFLCVAVLHGSLRVVVQLSDQILQSLQLEMW